MMWMFSVICLSLVAAICTWCILDPEVDDGLIQRLGMLVLVLACLGRAKDILEAGTVNPVWVSVHAGMALYSIGSAIKIMTKRLRAMGCKPLLKLDARLRWRKVEALRRQINSQSGQDFRF